MQAVALIGDLNTDEDVGALPFRHPVTEFRQAAFGQLAAKRAKASRRFRNFHRQHRFTSFAEFGPFRDEAQPVEIHVGATGDGHQGLILEAALRHVLLHPCHGEGSRRFKDGTGVFEDILDGGADGIGVHTHHAIHMALGQGKGFFPHQTHRNPIREQTHLGQFNPLSRSQGLRHGVGIDRFHTNNVDLRPETFHISGHATNQAAAADREVDDIRAFGALTHHFEPDGALSGNHLGVIEGVNEGQAIGLAAPPGLC